MTFVLRLWVLGHEKKIWSKSLALKVLKRGAKRAVQVRYQNTSFSERRLASTFELTTHHQRAGRFAALPKLDRCDCAHFRPPKNLTQTQDSCSFAGSSGKLPGGMHWVQRGVHSASILGIVSLSFLSTG